MKLQKVTFKVEPYELERLKKVCGSLDVTQSALLREYINQTYFNTYKHSPSIGETQGEYRVNTQATVGGK